MRPTIGIIIFAAGLMAQFTPSTPCPGGTTNQPGTINYVLQTNGNGTCTWVAAGGGSLPATVVQTNQANTYTTGLQDFALASVNLPSTATVGSATITFPGSTATLATLGANTFTSAQTIAS